MPSEPRGIFLLVRSLADPEGIWIDEEGVANLPSALDLPVSSGARQTVRILETTGINSIWMLCWLEAAASSVSRVDPVAALLACFGHEETEAATLVARLIPVFPGDELRALGARYPGLVPSPLCPDGNGDLRLPPAQPHAGGTPS